MKLSEENGDDGAWIAYENGFIDRLEEAEVRLVRTIYTQAFRVPDEFGAEGRYIRSLYVADLTRYEHVSAPGMRDEDGDAILEDHVQEAFVPRDEGRLRRWRRRRARRR